MKSIIHTSKAPAAIGPYSQAVRIGNTVFLSGQLGINPATGELAGPDAASQARQSLANLKTILEESGATIENVVKTTVFLTDMENFASVNEVYGKTFSDNPPARSCVAVAALPKNGLVEIEAIAIL